MYSLHEVDRIWGIWESYYTVPKDIFYLLEGDYICWVPSLGDFELFNQHSERTLVYKGHLLRFHVRSRNMISHNLSKAL